MPNVQSVEEEVILTECSFMKTDESGSPLAGAEFTLYDDADCITALDMQVSDAKGRVSFDNLLNKHVYYVKETKACNGYMLDDTVYVMSQNDSGVWYLYARGDTGKEPVTAIVNYTAPIMPNTGSDERLILVMFGMLVLMAGLCIVYEAKKMGVNKS